MKSNSEKVREFTEESTGIRCPEKPSALTRAEVSFVIKMVLSELTELAQTVSETPESALRLVEKSVGVDFNPHYLKPTDEAEIIAQQVDAAVDAEYYLKNALCKRGIDADRIFDLVHEANLRKKWPDESYHLNEFGKVVKPPGWREPDVVNEIRRQLG